MHFTIEMEPSQNDSKFEEHLSLVPLFSNGARYSNIQIYEKRKRQKKTKMEWSVRI